MYADRITDAMARAMDETNRRRDRQRIYNEQHGITPRTVVRSLNSMDPSMGQRDYVAIPAQLGPALGSEAELGEQIELLRSQMLLAAEALDFERAARLRDQIRMLEGGAKSASATAPSRGRGAAPAKAARRGRSRRQ
jgi:excinuclease ABC subunit B